MFLHPSMLIEGVSVLKATAPPPSLFISSKSRRVALQRPSLKRYITKYYKAILAELCLMLCEDAGGREG
jgi:hypothetical protein